MDNPYQKMTNFTAEREKLGKSNLRKKIIFS